VLEFMLDIGRKALFSSSSSRLFKSRYLGTSYSHLMSKISGAVVCEYIVSMLISPVKGKHCDGGLMLAEDVVFFIDEV
jgi:hypothetical protein